MCLSARRGCPCESRTCWGQKTLAPYTAGFTGGCRMSTVSANNQAQVLWTAVCSHYTGPFLQAVLWLSSKASTLGGHLWASGLSTTEWNPHNQLWLLHCSLLGTSCFLEHTKKMDCFTFNDSAFQLKIESSKNLFCNIFLHPPPSIFKVVLVLLCMPDLSGNHIVT